MIGRESGESALLGDVPVEFVGATARHREALATAFGRLAPTDLDPPARIEFAPGNVPLPERPADDNLDDQLGWREGGAYLVEYAGLSARVADHVATVRGSGPDLARRLAWIGQPVLAYLLAPHDRPLLHAAAIERDGRAVLIVGASGRGKSTTTFAALQAGWRILGDDHIVLRAGANGIELCGIPKPVSVPGELAATAPPGARRLDRDDRRRWQLPSTVMGDGWHPLLGTVWMGHATSPLGSIEPADSLALLRELVASHPASGSRDALARLMPLASAVARGPAWCLRLGADLPTRVADCASMLDRIATGSHPDSDGAEPPAGSAGRSGFEA